MPGRELDWYLSRLERVTKVSDGYTAACPAHDDRVNSLHLTPKSDGTVLVHCFAGCEFSDVLKALDPSTPEKRSQPEASSELTPRVVPLRDPLDWWEKYTQISRTEWESWGVTGNRVDVCFTWSRVGVEKHRRVGTKEFSWQPPGAPRPWLWPEVPDSLPDEIWVAEGESDTGVLKHLGYIAFGVTKGAGSVPPSQAWTTLKARGAKRVVLCFDLDQAGTEGQDKLVAAALSGGLEVWTCDLSKHLDVLSGEKDLRDLFQRISDDQLLIDQLESSKTPFSIRESRLDLSSTLSMRVIRPDWLVDGIWLSQTIGMIVASPKMGKTWFALDLGISIATGTPFLGEFPVTRRGTVVYIPKEDPPYLLQDRLAKILIGKGFGGEVSPTKISLPKPISFPWFTDLSHTFSFTPDKVQSLIEWLKELETLTGHVDLVVMDPLLRMVPGIDEWKAGEVSETIFEACEKIRTDLGSSVLLVHHRGHTKEERAYGSIGFRAFSEATLILLGEELEIGEPIVVKAEYKSEISRRWSFTFEDLSSTYRVSVLRSVPKVLIRTSRAAEVKDFLSTITEGATLEEISDKLEISHSYTRDLLKEMFDKGEIESTLTPSSQQGGRPKERWALRDPRRPA